jgi:hypothetical protein
MHQIEGIWEILIERERDRQTQREGGVLEVERNPKNRMNKEERRGRVR